MKYLLIVTLFLLSGCSSCKQETKPVIAAPSIAINEKYEDRLDSIKVLIKKRDSVIEQRDVQISQLRFENIKAENEATQVIGELLGSLNKLDTSTAVEKCRELVKRYQADMFRYKEQDSLTQVTLKDYTEQMLDYQRSSNEEYARAEDLSQALDSTSNVNVLLKEDISTLKEKVSKKGFWVKFWRRGTLLGAAIILVKIFLIP
jgi:hypothetical protein